MPTRLTLDGHGGGHGGRVFSQDDGEGDPQPAVAHPACILGRRRGGDGRAHARPAVSIPGVVGAKAWPDLRGAARPGARRRRCRVRAQPGQAGAGDRHRGGERPCLAWPPARASLPPLAPGSRRAADGVAAPGRRSDRRPGDEPRLLLDPGLHPKGAGPVGGLPTRARAPLPVRADRCSGGLPLGARPRSHLRRSAPSGGDRRRLHGRPLQRGDLPGTAPRGRAPARPAASWSIRRWRPTAKRSP